MVDHSARQFLQADNCHLKSGMRVVHVSKIEVAIARSYTDDAEVRHGAMSAPRINSRPGQRDDVVSCAFAQQLPIM
jgi:hypothetical protein